MPPGERIEGATQYSHHQMFFSQMRRLEHETKFKDRKKRSVPGLLSVEPFESTRLKVKSGSGPPLWVPLLLCEQLLKGRVVAKARKLAFLGDLLAGDEPFI